MDIGTAIIIGGIANIFGMMLFMYTRDLAYFKKENFKVQKWNVMNTNKLQLKKLEKELGVSLGKQPKEQKGLLDSLQGLDLDKIKGLIDFVQKEPDEDYEPDDLGSLFSTLVKDNPEVIKSFLAGFNKNKNPNDSFYQN